MLSTTSKIKNTTELGSEQEKGVLDSPGKLMIVPKGSYRKIAQKNWNLTDEQMKGMHVHHRILVSEGGTNDPANLYVCSPFFHYYVWHDGDKQKFVIMAAKVGGQKGGKAPSSEKQKAAAQKTGERNVRDGIVSKAGKVSSAQRWQCTVTGHVSNAGGLAKYHKAKGIDPSNRIRIR